MKIQLKYIRPKGLRFLSFSKLLEGLYSSHKITLIPLNWLIKAYLFQENDSFNLPFRLLPKFLYNSLQVSQDIDNNWNVNSYPKIIIFQNHKNILM